MSLCSLHVILNDSRDSEVRHGNCTVIALYYYGLYQCGARIKFKIHLLDVQVDEYSSIMICRLPS